MATESSRGTHKILRYKPIGLSARKLSELAKTNQAVPCSIDYRPVPGYARRSASRKNSGWHFGLLESQYAHHFLMNQTVAGQNRRPKDVHRTVGIIGNASAGFFDD